MKNKNIKSPLNTALKHELITLIKNYIKEEKLTQVAAAEKFSVTQPRISDLVRGKEELFALDSLIQMAEIAGYRVEIKFTKEK